MNQDLTKGRVHIAGAGIVGIAIAANLVQRGYQVTVVDREGPAAGGEPGERGRDRLDRCRAAGLSGSLEAGDQVADRSAGTPDRPPGLRPQDPALDAALSGSIQSAQGGVQHQGTR
ncbi:hypothetical protein QW131_19670 [Roseibium salinum]|nr:hypothetical protein [Roseibium salinum]